MRLAPLYRCTFAPTERWSVELRGEAGVEEQGFLLVDGRASGRLSGRLLASNFPRGRTDGTQTPDFRGALQTDDGATVLFSWHGYGLAAGLGPRRLVGAMTHVTDDERYRWLNGVVCAVAGEIRSRAAGGFDVVLEVAELIWEPVGGAAGSGGGHGTGAPPQAPAGAA